MSADHSFETISHRLDESTRRRRLVEQLRTPSPVRQLIAGSLSGLVTAAIFFVVNSLMRGEPSWVALTVAFSVSAGLWSSFDVIAVRRRLATLTAVLEESGALDAYIDRGMSASASAEPAVRA